MPYVGQKPADIISTAVDTVTGTFSGEVDAASLDISGNIDVDGVTNLDVVDIDGAVDMASTLAVAGVVTANAGVVVDEMTLDADTLTATDTFTIDAVGDITLDADGGDIILKDGGTEFGNIANSSSDLQIVSIVSDKDIIFRGNDGGSFINALTLDMSADGHATFKNGVTLTDGNLVVASGHGIDFSATANSSGTMSSELLDDYEEGTWTPSLGGNASYIHQSGTYVKIGRKVFLSCDIKINVIGTGVATQLNGAPFAAMSTGFPQGGISIMYYDAIATAVTSFNGYMNNNNSVITFSGNTGTAATTIGLNGFNVFKNSARVSFSIAYQTA